MAVKEDRRVNESLLLSPLFSQTSVRLPELQFPTVVVAVVRLSLSCSD